METVRITTNTKNIQILTKTGFQPFHGIRSVNNKQLLRLFFSGNHQIDATNDHKFPIFNNKGQYMGLREAGKMTANDFVDTQMGLARFLSRDIIEVDIVYDILQVNGDNTFYANSILTHNCHFISSDPLLIDTNKLKDLNDVVTAPVKITNKHGIHMWESFKPGKTYIVGVDPSTGSGSDYSVINVFSFPELVQVAQWRSNTMSSPELYIILKDILRAINTVGAKAYFSIENNGVGEGVISLYQVDDTQPANCDFVSDVNAPSKRLGFTTINRTKLTSCLLLKDLLEKDSMTIKSPQLLSELKTFIKKSATYTAQYGCTDDSISSVLIVLRILENITGYEQMAFEKIFIERKRKANISLTQRAGIGREDFS